VRWRESMQAMIVDGITSFVEIGPKDVLAGLMKRIDADRPVQSLGTVEALGVFVGS